MKFFTLPVLPQVFLKPLTARIILCCGVLCGLLEVLALLEEASTILSRHLGFLGLLKFMLLHLPALAVEIMPLSVMIGALFTLLQMTLSSEIAVMRAAGLSTFNMYRYMLPAPLLIGLVAMTLQFWVVPLCEQDLNIWWNKTATLAGDYGDLQSLWFREKSMIVRVEEVSHGGLQLKDVTFYDRDRQTGLLMREIHFPELHTEGRRRSIWHPHTLHWVSSSPATQTCLSATHDKATLAPFTEPPPLKASARQIINMTQEEPRYTPHQMWKAMHGTAPSSLPPSNYLMAFFSTLFLPVQMAVMLLITLPVTYIPPRAGLRNPLPVYVMASGLGIVILQGMISALGNAGSIPVLIAVSSGLMIAALFSWAWILQLEEK